MIRKKNLYAKPKKMYEKSRIMEENALVKKYGLKNKKEIWKTTAKIKYFRRRAMDLAKSPMEEQEVLFSKLRAIGLNVNSTSDVLGLQTENLLERRLPTLVFRKKLANTPQHARQMVVHKKVFLGEKVVDSPSYIVPVEEEQNIKVKQKIRIPKSIINTEKIEEAKE